MKTRIFLLAAFLCCLFSTQKLEAQVDNVNYQIKYNADSCFYDAFFIVNSGSATSAAERTQFNSQYTIVVPTGTTVTITRSYAPFIDNQAGGATTGIIPWAITSSVNNPSSLSGFDVKSVTVPLSPSSQYNDLNSGDTVKIFSFTLSSITNCGAAVRLWNNATDPASDQPGMLNSDWSNGFTLGGIAQLYNDNSTTVYPPKPVIVNPPLTTCGNGIEIDLSASTGSCQTPLTYAWTGPNSYTSTSQDVSIVPATTANVGLYKVVVTDNIGCKDSITVNATNKPNAGADQTVCAGTTASISGSDPTTGTWAARAGNPTGATLSLLTAGNAQVTFSNAASGTYRYVYSTTTCSDTMAITVSPRPTVSITGSTSICIGATSQLSPATGGTWVSNTPGVATVSNINPTEGQVTAVAQGTATFTFTSAATGCQATTNAITVNPPPTAVITGTPAVCIGSTTTVSPVSGGTWASSNNLIATVTNAGVVTGVSAGSINLVFTETSTGCISNTISITVTAKPTVAYSGPTSICVLGSTNLTPASGGTWASSNSLVATISNSGLVTGLTPGTVTFTWTETSTGCSSDASGSLTVVAAPTVTANPPTICAGSTTTLSPTTGGTWTSNNALVATITNGGVVTGVASGVTFFTFTETSSGCSKNTGNITVNPRPTVLAANSNICIGGTTTLTPASGGTWASLNGAIATVSGNTVTGVTAGTATMRFTETASGCTNTIDITVRTRPTVSITGADEICIGFTTQLSPTTGGSWASSNGAIATVSNAGLVTGIAVGTVTFTFTDALTGCPSLPTNPVTVKNKPTVSISGSNLICIGATTTLAVNPVTAGTWTAVNPGIASVDPVTGVVTAAAAGFARFNFTETGGCVSDNTAPVTVNAPPAASFTGPNPICVGFNTNMTPTTGGTWSSASPLVATINNAGLVTALSAGTSVLTFTQTSTGCASAPLTLTVSPKPTVVLTGASPICIGGTSTVTPTTGGVWASSAPLVASITNGGLITGLTAGTSIFIFTSTAGCASDPIISVAVNPAPTVNVTGPSAICIGTTTKLSPTTGGTWTSLNPLVATVLDSIVTGVAVGVTQFVFTSTAGCASLPTTAVTVNPKPVAVLNGPASICQGNTTLLSPTTGGSWTSTDNAVATITNTGIVTGVTVGTARFIFTNATTGCASDQSAQVAVTTGPSVAITDTVLCIGATTTVTPNSGGTWTSSNAAVATITNGGLVTAVSAGLATFSFRDAAGCLSMPTKVLTVNPRPTVIITGTPEICIGGSTQLSPTTGGTWASNHGSIASVTSGGVVQGLAAGIATFTFTSTATTCSSLPTDTVTVTPAAVVGFTGPDVVCVNGTTQLFPTTGGVWVSNNTAIATVTNSGVVTSKGPGKVTFTFTSGAGCPSGSSTGELTVQHCFNPDFNATFVNVTVPGDVNTNDNVDPATTYGPTPLLISKPSGSLETLTMSSDGTYTFVANTEGVYIYNVPVCIPPLTAGCPLSLLTITVRNNINPTKLPIANTDFASTPINTAVTLNSLENDRCVLTVGCTLDAASVTITVAADNGATSINSGTGAITYTPNNGFVGIDTLTYQVCVTAESGNCATAIQIITVSSAGVDNTTVAADDFAVTPQDVTVTGNVKTNDSDPEGNTQTVTPQTTSKTGGTLTLLADGSYSFKPDTLFYGPVEFVYQTTDNHPTAPATASATLHILVMQDFTIKVRVYLEGAIMNGTGTADDGRPLMRDNLRVSPFTGARYIPIGDPYKIRPNSTYSASFANKFTKVGPGTRGDFDTIPVPSTVFGVSGQNAIVDWVFIELRSKTTNTTVLGTRSGLLQRDGDVVDLDGVSGLRFPGIAMDDYYVVVRHNRHLGVMTRDPQTPTQLTTLVNFTTTTLPTFDFGTSHPTIGNVVNYTGLAQKTGTRNWLNYRALWAGDFDANGKVKYDNPNDDLNVLAFAVNNYNAANAANTGGLSNTAITSNFDFAYGYLNADFDMNGKAKFDNPNDDKNMLYGQLIFYPKNTSLLSNYDFAIEQLPKP